MKRADSHSYLGLQVTSDLSWTHTTATVKEAAEALLHQAAYYAPHNLPPPFKMRNIPIQLTPCSSFQNPGTAYVLTLALSFAENLFFKTVFTSVHITISWIVFSYSIYIFIIVCLYLPVDSERALHKNSNVSGLFKTGNKKSLMSS